MCLRLFNSRSSPSHLGSYSCAHTRRSRGSLEVPSVPRRYRHVEYWTLPLRVKLSILVFLTDEVLQSSIVRSELDTRLEVSG